MNARALEPWRNGEAAVWFLLAPLLGVAFAWSAAVPMAFDASVFVIATFVGIICGFVMMPAMVFGAWRRHAGIAFLLQLVGGSFTAGVASGALSARSTNGGQPVTAIMLTAAAVVVIAAISRLVLPRRPSFTPPGMCPRCGYDLAGLRNGTCPECGDDDQ